MKPLPYDEEKAERAVDFFSRFLRHRIVTKTGQLAKPGENTLHVQAERTNGMLTRNLEALRDLQEGSLVNHADQVKT